MQIDIFQIMNNLSKLRPIFHSEADFQHALAWEVHRRFPKDEIRLELPVKSGDRRLHLDLWLSHQKQSIAIELKYKTRILSVPHNDEHYILKNQSAQDIGRYDFLRDLQRLEMVSTNLPNSKGYAILLTNDSSYWSHRPGAQTVDAAFRLNEGRSIHGKLSWDSAASSGTTKSRENPLNLTGTYNVKWQNYSLPDKEPTYGFKYLCFAVP